ncbi:MAG TPA: SRPBCC family protein [bacterium]|nr:SRPBCC family protein [bacterium]
MPAHTADGATTVTDCEIIAVRQLDAPRDLVFQMWTDPEHLARWWGPSGFTTTTHAIDVRPGGHWRFTMHGPDGTDYENHIVYIEIVQSERIVYKHVPVPGAEPVSFEATVILEDINGKTRLTVRALFPSAKALEYVAAKYGAIEGMKQHLARLAESVSQLQKGTP